MEPYTSRFKQNETVTTPFLQKATKKKQPQFTAQRRNRKPTCKNLQRSKLSSVHGVSESKEEEKGFQEFQKKMKKSDDSHILSSDHEPESAIDDSEHERTPPVEASLSPEIQSQPQSKTAAPNSVGTPLSYGAGHLLSCVSDKRKSRRRGSLRGGLEKVIPFSGVDDMQKSSIPLLSEASIRWHLSPCDFGNDLDDDRIEYDVVVVDDDDDDLCTVDLLSSVDFLCSNSRCGGSSNVRNNAIESRGIFDESMPIASSQANYNGDGISLSRDDLVGSWNCGNFIPTLESGSTLDGEARLSNSVRQEFDSITENLDFDESMLIASSQATYNGNGISLSRDDLVGSWNSGDFIPTLESGSTSDGDARLRQEFDSITETLERVKLSPRSEISMWDVPGLGSLVPIRLQRDAGCVSSWVSDTTSNDPTVSQMRMSWCEGLVSGIAGADEFDHCCCCLSDERVEEKETDQGNSNSHTSLSPVLLDYEPRLIAEGKEKSFRNNACAESICTDGGGLLASGGSDWANFQENPLVSCHIEQVE